MKPHVNKFVAGGLLLAIAGGATPLYASETPVFADVITVTAKRPELPEKHHIDAQSQPAVRPDAAGLVARLPGAALTNNGALSGQVQYRGLYGARIGIRVDGQYFESAGPNLMDPPLHYAPLPLLSAIQVSRGASGVTRGPALGGAIDARFKEVPFNAEDSTGAFVSHYDLTSVARSQDESFAVGGVAGLANERFRFQLLGSLEEGHGGRFPGGDLPGSDYEREVLGLGMGWRVANGEGEVSFKRLDTGPSGNAAFAMDIEYVHGDQVHIEQTWMPGGFDLNVSLGYSDIDHAMNNYGLRPPPVDSASYRRTLAEARTVDARVSLTHEAGRGELIGGIDHSNADKSVMITHPENRDFYLTSLPGIALRRSGVFMQWRGPVGGWEMEAGLRVDRYDHDAGVATTGGAVPMMPSALAAGFNSGDRRWQDTTRDVVVRLWRDVGDSLVWRLTLASKQRVPGYVERFAWLPTPASGGLADGNTWVGDRQLEAETARSIETGFDWYADRAFIRPTFYYRQVDEFIEGVPFDDTPGVIDSPVEMVSAMNGDATPLRFANTEAALYGIDVDFGLQLATDWRIEGVLTVVRGERRDIDDNLYRLTPPTLTLGLTRGGGDWSVSLEGQVVDAQDRVSALNGEKTTSGYAVFRLLGDWQMNRRVNVAAGIDNLFDREYERHLAGYNRIPSDDVPVGARIPGPGQGVFVKLHYRFER